ncbi:MAG: hypothetical protein WCO66_04065 [Candidatus Absconditabacteria bacterium]
MLDKIKKMLFSFYDKNDKIGLFFSLYDANNALILSSGTLVTDKSMNDLVDILYHSILEKQTNVHTVTIDIVKEVQLKPDMANLMNLSPKEYGIFAINKESQKTGVILPNMQGVDTIQVALALIKQKHDLSGNVEISTFTTRRIAFTV